MTTIGNVTEQWHGHVPVAHLEGEIDTSNVNDLGERIRTLVSNRLTVLVVDLTDLAYIDSAGINLLFALGDELAQRQQVLRLVIGPGTPTARMLEITGVNRTHSTYPTLEAALAGG